MKSIIKRNHYNRRSSLSAFNFSYQTRRRNTKPYLKKQSNVNQWQRALCTKEGNINHILIQESEEKKNQLNSFKLSVFVLIIISSIISMKAEAKIKSDIPGSYFGRVLRHDIKFNMSDNYLNITNSINNITKKNIDLDTKIVIKNMNFKNIMTIKLPTKTAKFNKELETNFKSQLKIESGNYLAIVMLKVKKQIVSKRVYFSI